MPRHITRRYFGWQAYPPLALVTTLLFGLLSTSALADKPVVAINSLIDGLHKDAAAARFENYFERYTDDAVFLGTDKTERWTIDPPLSSVMLRAIQTFDGLTRFCLTKS